MKWANAALRACAFPVRAAILEVTVVPMFSPITSAIPRYRSNTPLEHNINVIAITAADDCTAIVIMPPISRNNSTENIPHSLQDAIKDRSTWSVSYTHLKTKFEKRLCMKNDLLYENLVTAIKDKFPGRGVLTNKLADLLMLEKEAVYRRLRGDVPFTIFEIATIAAKLDISLDHIIGCSSGKSRPFQMKMVNFLNPSEEDYEMLENFVNELRYLKDDPNSEVGGALNILPQSLVLGYRHIYRFYLFKWIYQCGNVMPARLSLIHISCCT